jgi:5-methylcytosine-specific restriction enzyme subunit McrC
MKGQLLFSQNISHNLIHQERLYVRYAEYNRNNIFNQILYKTLCLITVVSRNASVTDKANRLLLDFPEMPDCKVTFSTFDKLVFDRKTERYKEALLISKMLLLNYRPDITGGAESVIAIMFDMNQLWEEFVYRRLVKSAGDGVQISRQNRRKFWYNTKDDFHKDIRPDIVITKNGKTFIFDTKWKIINDNRPGDDDLKQMFVYNLLWDAEKSFLLYPGTHETCQGSYHHFELSKLSGKKHQSFYNDCSLAFIDLCTKEGKLVSNEPIC